mgnify:CR=1 FL=1
MKKTSLIPICDAIFNADTTVFTDGEKLLRLSNVFDAETLTKIATALDDINPSEKLYKDHKARTLYDFNDQEAITQDDIEAIQAAVETAVGTKYQSMGVSLWEDKDSYYIGKHTDGEGLNAAMQIYLPAENCALPNTGTIMYDGIQEYQVPFVPNTGYFITNSNTIVHSSGDPVKPGMVRRSLYFYFTK